MKYSIGESVYVIKSGEFKTIVDSEFICGIELYYMSDLTSFPLEQLTKFKNLKSREELDKKLSDNKERIVNLINYEKVSKNWSEWFLKNSDK